LYVQSHCFDALWAHAFFAKQAIETKPWTPELLLPVLGRQPDDMLRLVINLHADSEGRDGME
jgi:hypothetical protein